MSVDINLLPWRQELKIRKKQEFLILMGAFSGLTLALVLSVHFIIANKINFQRENNGILKSEISLLDKKIEEIESLQKEKEKLLARMHIIQELQSNRPNIVRLFDMVARTIPQGLYLSSLTRADLGIMIEGKAESNTRVSKFMRNIEGSKWLDSPVLSVIQADDESLKKGERWIGFNLQAVQVIPKQ